MIVPEIQLNGGGVRGGNLNNPVQQPEQRRAPLNAVVNADGLPTLHRFEKHDAAVCGRANEMPWHRMAAFMLLGGRTNSEIAVAAGVNIATVSQLRSQRWFQELLAVLANETGEDITGLVQAEAAESVQKLVYLRDFAESERVQLTAATTLLEHASGKPVQKIISNVQHSVRRDPKDEMDAIQTELNALRERNE